jgi:MEMO1 family protein
MTDDVPPRPRLRAVEVFPTQLGPETAICLRDPAGIAERPAFLPRAAGIVLAFCDGQHTLEEIAAEFRARTGVSPEMADLRRLVAELDTACFLVSPRLAAREQAIAEAYHAAPTRAAIHAGGAYPAGAEALSKALFGFGYQAASGSLVAAGSPEVLIAPHIDFHRGGPVYASAYQTLPARPDLVVVFGTDHNGIDHPFTLTRKSYDTPLGVVATDTQLVDDLARACQGSDLFAEELHHRNEHSVEFQAVWLRFAYGQDAPPILPVLCGSFHRAIGRGSPSAVDARIPRFLDELRRLTEGRRVLVIAGADLAHVGPRFGDGPMGGEASRETVAKADHAALQAAATGDADAFFAAVADERDRFRVCGLSPIFASLAFAGRKGGGKLIGYEQCAADEAGDSFVSIAAMTV